jgi:hypothetical protein
VLDLDGLFDDLDIDTTERTGRIGLTDTGASVDVWFDSDGDALLDAKIATIQSTDAISIGADVLIGTYTGETPM